MPILHDNVVFTPTKEMRKNTRWDKETYFGMITSERNNLIFQDNKSEEYCEFNIFGELIGFEKEGKVLLRRDIYNLVLDFS
jgi:hypothetical protein